MFSWIRFLSYAVATAASPGPNNIMSLSLASGHGIKYAFRYCLGQLTGLSVQMLLCTFLCNALNELIPKVKTPMLILSAAYILWLAWCTFRSSSDIEESQTIAGFRSGVIMQFINPTSYIYCIVSMEAYVLPYYSDQSSKLVFFALLLSCIAFILTMMWGVFGSFFRILFSKYSKVTNTVMALLLVYCAVALLLN